MPLRIGRRRLHVARISPSGAGARAAASGSPARPSPCRPAAGPGRATSVAVSAAKSASWIRLRDAERFSLAVCRFSIVDEKRFCTAPSAARDRVDRLSARRRSPTAPRSTPATVETSTALTAVPVAAIASRSLRGRRSGEARCCRVIAARRRVGEVERAAGRRRRREAEVGHRRAGERPGRIGERDVAAVGRGQADARAGVGRDDAGRRRLGVDRGDGVGAVARQRAGRR